MIKVTNITKSYGRKKVLSCIDLTVKSGALFGLVGPDAAGKTTLLNIMATASLPDTGDIIIGGINSKSELKKVRNLISYMPAGNAIYEDLTIEENFAFFSMISNNSPLRPESIPIYTQLKPFAKYKVRELSGGMKQKVAICCALASRPSVLLLDEPTTGIDPPSRKELWGLLQNLSKRGISIVISTPHLEEAGFCDNIAILSDGKILAIGTPISIVDNYRGTIMRITTSGNTFQLLRFLKSSDLFRHCQAFGQYIHVVAPCGASPMDLTNYLEANNWKFSVEIAEPSLEDCFLQLTNNEKKHSC